MLELGFLGEQTNIDFLDYVIYVMVTLSFVYTGIKVIVDNYSTEIGTIIFTTLAGGFFIVISIFWQNVLYTNPITWEKAISVLTSPKNVTQVSEVRKEKLDSIKNKK